jgi:N-acetylglucosaminyl-diphospho-decaprenol L-rhamnosyltransferase
MDLSVCIVSFNTRAVLERTLRAVQEATDRIAAELIVVDNGSSDGTLRMLKETFPGVRLVANAENRFFSAGTNQAFALSSGRYVLSLNSDAIPQPEALVRALSHLESHPDIGAATLRMLHPDGRVQRICALFSTYAYLLLEHTFLGAILPGRLRREREAVRYADWDRSTERTVDVLPGSFILTRAEALRYVGGYDERLRLYFSDDDWCMRLQRAGYQAVYLPVGDVVHPESTSVRQVRGLARRIYFEDLIAYTRKYFGVGPARWLGLLSWPTRGGQAIARTLRGD